MTTIISELSSFYKRLFLFYRETGMRLREPFITTLNGNWLDISSKSKSHVGRSMELNSYLKTIYKEYMNWLKIGYGNSLKDTGDHISKLFKKCLVRVNAPSDKNFHSLRHIFAVRSLIKGVPIYNLKLFLGHTSVVTTEEYSNMNLKRVAYDFPSISFSLSKDKPRNHKEDTERTQFL